MKMEKIVAQDFLNQKIQELRLEILCDEVLYPLVDMQIKIMTNLTQTVIIEESASQWKMREQKLVLSDEKGNTNEIVIHGYDWVWDLGVNGKYHLEYDKNNDVLDIKHHDMEMIEKAVHCFLTRIKYQELIDKDALLYL